jgi:tRNA(Ile)-lysidine synthase
MERHLSRLALTLRPSIRAAGLLQPGDSVGVAVSAGADSVALLGLLLELREELGIIPAVVHFNHQLRGQASDADEKFVAGLAAKHALPFLLGSENVAAIARREKSNLEDAARRARYQFFTQLVEQGKLTCIAVAHTADDQAETVLAHILRGTGLAGLAGIHPTSGDVVRPLLHLRRSTLRAYLRERKQAWREDSTNRDLTKTRARIRKKLLPLLETQFQPATVLHLNALAAFAREDNAYLDSMARAAVEALCKKENGAFAVNALEFLTRSAPLKSKQGRSSSRVSHTLPLSNRAGPEPTPPAKPILRRMIRQMVSEVKPQAGQLTAAHVESILRLAERGENGKSLPLPGGVEVRRHHDHLIFRAIAGAASKNNRSPCPKKFEFPVDFSGREAVIKVPCLACVFRFRKIDWPAITRETRVTRPVLDLHALRVPLVLRNWRPGDQFQPAGHRKAHKLKRLLNEQRISRWEREGWPVLVSAGVVVWARAFPVAAEFAANQGTRSAILIVEEKSP